MAPLARGFVGVAVATAAAAATAAAVGTCASGGGHGCPASEAPGLVLIQKGPSSVSKVAAASAASELQQAAVDPDPDASPPPDATRQPDPATQEASGSVADLHAEIAELKTMMLNMQQMLSDKSTFCCQGCAGGSGAGGGGGQARTPGPGLCAVFGDPHVTTFDGAHTILLRDMPMWLVKSNDVWIQALAVTTTGNLMGLAVGGPFMEGHRLVIYNSTLVGQPAGKLVVMFDDTEILDDYSAQGSAEFEEPFLLWAARRTEWNTSLHDSAVLGIKPAIEWDVGPWGSRFTDVPAGGLYYFKFPNDVELTVTGVDFMSSVIKAWPRTGGQGGYCGDFNGIATDEYTPPAPGSVPPVLVPAWNTAAGADLEPIPREHNLFERVPALMTGFVQLASQKQDSAAAARRSSPCRSAAVLQKSEQACRKIPDDDLRSACVADYCLTGSASAVEGVAMAGLMEERLGDGTGVLFVGKGPCRDEQGRAFRVVPMSDVRSEAGCEQRLGMLAGVKGVLGAQLKTEGACEVVVLPDTSLGAVADAADLGRNFKGGFGTTDPQLGGLLQVVGPPAEEAGAGFVAGVSKDLSWSCWRLG